MSKSLKKQITSGLAWRGGADISQQVLQIVFTMVLARLLTKGEFGLVAMALLVNRFVRSITNLGFGTAIIQSQDITKGQISAIFYIQAAINIVLTTIVYFSAGLAASFFGEPELVPLIKVISFVILLQTLQFPNILLRKDMKFKSFSIIEIVSMVTANIAAISMALYGFGVWSLVWRLIIQRTVFGILSFYYGKWMPSKPEFKGVKPLFKFGVNMLGSNVFYYFAENLVALMTGKFLGKDTMGLFNIAYNLAIVPATKIQSILTSVLTSGFSKIQHDIKNFSKGFTMALKNTALFFIPLMMVIGATSRNTIPLFYGEKWSEAALFLTILCFVGILRGLSHILRSAIIAMGKSDVIFYSTIIELVTSLPFMYFGMKEYGIYGLIIGYLIGAIAGWAYTSFHYDKVLEYKNASLKAIKLGATISAVVFTVTYSINYLDFSKITLLLLQLATALLIFIFMFKKLDNVMFQTLYNKLTKRKSK